MVKQLAPEMTEAIQAYKNGLPDESRKRLVDYLCNSGSSYDALLWLAKVTHFPDEAIHAAELAFALKPDDEVAARAIASVRERFGAQESAPRFEIARITGMTISQARAVVWTSNNLRQPMGVLLDEDALKLKDLAWGAQNAYDGMIKQASRTLLLDRLLNTQLLPTKQPAKFIKGFSYPAYRERMATLNGGVVVGILGALAAMLLIVEILNILLRLSIGPLLNLASLIMVAVAVILYFVADKIVKVRDQSRMGREGEEKVVEIFRASLLHPWVIISNFRWPNRKWGDVDCVLVGPSGIWAIEVKAYTGQYRNIGDRWQNHSRYGWHTPAENPTQQAQRNAANLRTYLSDYGIDPGWVNPVVIWAGNSDHLIVDDPAIPVWKQEEIQDRMEVLWRKQTLSEAQIEKATELLQKAIHTKEI